MSVLRIINQNNLYRLLVFLLILACSDKYESIPPVPPIEIIQTCEINTTRNCTLEDNIGVCRQGAMWCINGEIDGALATVWSECYAQNEPTDEICDGLDNNCNGDVDEVKPILCEPDGVQRIYYNSEDFPNSQCHMGLAYCRGGEWEECPVCPPGGRTVDNFNCWVGPSEEICDTIDNDCNNVIDDLAEWELEECGYMDDATHSYLGQCEYTGWEYCINGDIMCLDAVGPQSEVCDNVDNNCNGYVDEDIYRPCETECDTGLQTCLEGNWINCDADACECALGDIRICNGEPCGQGVQPCLADGTWSEECFMVEPVDEICNNHDDNCSCDWELFEYDPGAVNYCLDDIDEDPTTETGSLEELCYEGFPPETEFVGECHGGWKFCTTGEWSECFDQSRPRREICDGLDNDCDGLSDEDEDLFSNVDIVFVMDQSGSMNEDRRDLTEHLEAFSGRIEGEFRCGVVAFGGTNDPLGRARLVSNLGSLSSCIEALQLLIPATTGSHEPSYDTIYDIVHPSNPFGLNWRDEPDNFATPVIILLSDEQPQTNRGYTASTLRPFLENCQMPGCHNPPNIFWEEGAPVELFLIVTGLGWEDLIFTPSGHLFDLNLIRRVGLDIALQQIFERICVLEGE